MDLVIISRLLILFTVISCKNTLFNRSSQNTVFSVIVISYIVIPAYRLFLLSINNSKLAKTKIICLLKTIYKPGKSTAPFVFIPDCNKITDSVIISIRNPQLFTKPVVNRQIRNIICARIIHTTGRHILHLILAPNSIRDFFQKVSLFI